MFSLTSRKSFDIAVSCRQRIVKLLHGFEPKEIPMILVGNKVDLVNERQIDTKEGEELAEKFGCKYFEISTKENINVAECLIELVRRIDGYYNINNAVDKQDNNKIKEVNKK